MKIVLWLSWQISSVTCWCFREWPGVKTPSHSLKCNEDPIHRSVYTSPRSNALKKREILVSVRFKSGYKDIGHSRRVRVLIFETMHTSTWFKAMLNMMQEQIVLCKQGMLCWRELIKAIAAVMDDPWRRYKLLKIDQVLNILSELSDWETSVILYISFTKTI